VWRSCLVVLSVSLTLCIKGTGPVVSLEVGLCVDINLDINRLSSLLDWEARDTGWLEKSSEELSNSGWAPCSNDLSSLQGELGSENWVRDGSVRIDFSERKRLVDRRALVSKSVDGSLRVDGDTDSKTSGNTRSGEAWWWKVLEGDTRAVSKLGWKDLGHAKLSSRLEL
jgi:hypothetical protein